MAIKVYQYPKCSTCRKALKWLDERGVEYEEVDIVANPPSKTALRRILKRSGLPLKRLFNTSGASYREGGWSDRLKAGVTQEEALDALAADGKLIKRPLVDAPEFALIGFDLTAYDTHLSR